jgi:hypothetical protein
LPLSVLYLEMMQTLANCGSRPLDLLRSPARRSLRRASEIQIAGAVIAVSAADVLMEGSVWHCGSTLAG